MVALLVLVAGHTSIRQLIVHVRTSYWCRVARKDCLLVVCATDLPWSQLCRQRLRAQACPCRLEGIVGCAEVLMLLESLLTVSAAAFRLAMDAEAVF